MFKTFTACMQTKALQTFVTCIKEECLDPLTVASAPPIEEKHTEENQDCYKQGLPTTYQPQPIQQLPQYPEPQHCVLSVPPPTHYQTLTEQHYPNIPPPSYTEKDTNEHSTSLHPAPTVVKTDENTNTATNELVQQIVTYSNDNERRNNNKHHKTKHPATLESVTDDITVLNIGCRNRNANPNSYTRTTFTSTRSSRPPNGKDQKKLGTKGKNKHGKSDPSSHKKNRKNTGTACTEPKDYVRSYTTNFAEEDNEYPLYRLSVHSPDDKYTFPLVYTQAKLVDQENEQEKGELDFFFEKVSCDPADLWHNQEDSLKRRTYIQTIVIFAKCNDQHPNAKFTVHINLEDRVAMRIMKNQSIREDNLNNEVKNFILGSTHTTTNLKTRDNTTPEAENDVSRTFYITEPEQQFEYDAIRYQHCVICAKTTNGQRHPFTILPYSATVDSSCNEVIGENLFNNRSNYLAITHAACVQTNWCPMQANKALFSYCTGYDHGNYCDHNNYADDDDIATDGAMAPNQHIVGTDDFATAGRYRIVDARNLIKKTTSLHQFPPVIYKIHCLDLDHKNEQDVHTALKFLEDVN
ncbi:MAG: hypothetical protein QS721_14065 [Candidatus Endonucleobacter sp. (ex Gigantidas childressi)]|nr:hypothetical protein [Candidatus Endonucleobacter sp. (ex Gigantidas childressi)]